MQKKSKTPSQTYFKHTVYGLRFLLKSEGLPYQFLHLPEIKHEKKLPVVLSKEEVWKMLQGATLLKHKILIGLLYGCGLRCMEVRNVRLGDLDFDRKQLRLYKAKARKTAIKTARATKIRKCQCCKTGNLHTILIFDKRGPPEWFLGDSQKENVCKI